MIILSFLSGVKSASRSWKMLFLLYGINFIAAAIFAFALRDAVRSGFGSSAAVESILSGFRFSVFSDFMRFNQKSASAVTSMIPTAVFMMFIFQILLSGGIISAVRENGSLFSVRSFLSSSAAYAGRFLRLTGWFILFSGVINIVFGALFAVIFNAVQSSAVSELPVIAAVVAAAALFILLLLFELMTAGYARIAVVVLEYSNMRKALWDAVVLTVKNFFRCFGLQIGLTFISAAFFALYWFLSSQMEMSSLFTIAMIFLLQQVYIVSRIWIQILFVGSSAAMFEELRFPKMDLEEMEDTPGEEL